MADMARLFETESSPILEPALDISGGATLEALQTLDEAVNHPAPVMIEGDDSVFYSEDEEIPQDVLMCAPRSVHVGPIGLIEPQPLPQIQDSGAEELGMSLSHSTGPMESSSVHHGGAVQEGMENLMESKINHVSSSASVLAAEGEIEAALEELSKPSNGQRATSTRAASVVLSVEEKKLVDQNLLGHVITEISTESRLQQPSQEEDSAGADGSTATHEGCEETEEPDQDRHTKYATVSYRRIRRGITRQRIEEFEAMMQL